MKLLIDAGNTRLKWQLRRHNALVEQGTCLLTSRDWLDNLMAYQSSIDQVAVSTVVSRPKQSQLEADLYSLATTAKPVFYWAEPYRHGLTNAYSDVSRMGADRWHAMYAGWHKEFGGFAVLDAGSALTVDYVAADGRHLGGYILPGKQMMLRSLQKDAARIGFDPVGMGAGEPGGSTTECVQHGLIWLWEGLAARIGADCRNHQLDRVLFTGGDADLLLVAGLQGQHHPDLVLDGLAAIDAESRAQ